MQIIETESERMLEHDGEKVPLPALAVDTIVHAYTTPGGLWAGIQEPGKPRPVYPGAGGQKLGTIELAADARAVAENLATETRARLTAAIQNHLDATAQGRGYDGILSLCTYATSTHPRFAAEGQAGVEWRDAVWGTGFQLLDEVLADARAIPTEGELIGLLPEIKW